LAKHEVCLLQHSPHTSEAVSHVESAAHLNPQFPEALITLAKINLAAKQNDEAISLLNRAVQIVPDSITARYNLMMAYRNSGRTADAAREQQELDKLQKPPEGEFTNFLKKLGGKVPPQ